MAAGTPVIAAEAPFVREVCGDAALLVEASPRAIAGALRHIFGDAGVTRRLRIQGVARAAEFNWDRAASTMMGIYANALA
jgi:glycosyltransferase involved in cell wall biosynthesis